MDIARTMYNVSTDRLGLEVTGETSAALAAASTTRSMQTCLWPVLEEQLILQTCTTVRIVMTPAFKPGSVLFTVTLMAIIRQAFLITARFVFLSIFLRLLLLKICSLGTPTCGSKRKKGKYFLFSSSTDLAGQRWGWTK
jgi:hypothetical protein